MKIGILGAGNIGGTLTRRLSAAGHQVEVANSRGPETIPGELLTDGAQKSGATRSRSVRSWNKPAAPGAPGRVRSRF